MGKVSLIIGDRSQCVFRKQRMFPTQDTLPLWISGAALAVSIVFGTLNFATSRRALSVSSRASKLNEPNVSLYLLDSFRFRLPEANLSLYIFSISVSNRSTSANSITNCELRIKFVKDALERTGVFRHNTNGLADSILHLRNLLKTPSQLPARSGLIANLCFEVANELLADALFDNLLIQIECADGSTLEHQTNIIMDVVDAKHLEKKREIGVPI